MTIQPHSEGTNQFVSIDHERSVGTLTAIEALLIAIQERSGEMSLHEEGVRLLRVLSESTTRITETDSRIVSELLVILLTDDLVNHQHIAACSIGHLKRKYGIDSDTAATNSLAQSFGRDALFLLTLRRVINIDAEFEVFLGRLRRFILLEYQRNCSIPSVPLAVLDALAQQGFNNEYILYEDEVERSAIQEIEAYLVRTFSVEKARDSEIPLLVTGMYRSLAHLPFADQIEKAPIDTFSNEAREAITRTIREPFEEKRLSRNIASFGAITCRTSEAVRAQYEEHPFPRWFTFGRPKSLESRLKRLNPTFSWPFSSTEQMEILVPGCGTGRHPLSIAAAAPNAHVLALDLSLASLAYGQRMAKKLQIHNITFIQCDILEIPTLGKRFHHIDCFGVLHHLKDPMAGWEMLHQTLLPGGTLGVGVYSVAARMHIGFLRNEIARLQIQPTVDSMKEFRQRLLNEERYQSFLKLLQVKDFFSLSEFRDYLFHASEYRYTLAEIQGIIERFGFGFLGFEVRGSLKAKYCEVFPDDPRMNSLEHWRRFERQYVGTSALFSFWLQKPYNSEG